MKFAWRKLLWLNINKLHAKPSWWGCSNESDNNAFTNFYSDSHCNLCKANPIGMCVCACVCLCVFVCACTYFHFIFFDKIFDWPNANYSHCVINRYNTPWRSLSLSLWVFGHMIHSPVCHSLSRGAHPCGSSSPRRCVHRNRRERQIF